MKLAASAALLSLGACASLPPGSQPDPRDPYERVNRSIYQFNTKVDDNLLKPVATAYRDFFAPELRQMFGNFFANLGELPNTVHHLLRLDFPAAGNSAARFGLNTTLGVLGLGDPASEAGFGPNKQDFGLTFGFYGSEPGPYLMLPLLGPSSVRDGFGLVLDIVTDPFKLAFDPTSQTQLGVTASRAVDKRAELLEIGESADSLSFDRYLTFRSAYLASRAQKVADLRGEDPPPPPVPEEP